jgi:hypothetical protein
MAKGRFAFLALWFAAAGCGTAGYQLVPHGTLPAATPVEDIRKSPYFEELNRAYGKGSAYERAKIKYLLGHTRLSKWSFDRNGRVWDSEHTADTLQRKYLQRIEKVKTARDYIDKVATFSSTSGRDYYALPGDGKAYRTGEVLHHELTRLEKFMDELHRSPKNGSEIE